MKIIYNFYYFPGGVVVKNLSVNARNLRRCRLDPCVGKIPWKRARQPFPVFLPIKFHGQRSPAGYSPQGCTVSDATEVTLHTSMHMIFILIERLLKRKNCVWFCLFRKVEYCWNGMNVYPYIYKVAPSNSEYDLFGDRFIKEVMNLKMRLLVWAIIQYGQCPYKEMTTQKYRG